MTSTAMRGARNRSALRRLSPPRQQVRLCERALVLRSLEVARRGRLTVVLGPPGYGKTTALTQWHERLVRSGVRAAWLSATAAEREPSQFMTMLILALEASGIDPGAAARRAAGDGSADAILDSIVLGLENINEPVVLVVDDYDRIDHPPVAQCVSDILDALPASFHLVLATRRKPSLAVAALHVMGGVRVIDPDELRLNADEIAETLDIAAGSPEAGSIMTRTEGWPVAVQLYRLWRDRAGQADPLPRFGAYAAAEIADYLTEQVFSTLPEAHQDVLEALSIVEQVEASLADAIRGSDDSGEMLEAISAALPSLVQQTSAGDETAYRIHPLLSDYARGRLVRHRGRSALFHQRAASWLAQHDRHADAVRHAVLGRDQPFLLALLDRLPFRSVFLSYGAGELRSILQEVPSDILALSLNMRLMKALATFKDGFFIEGEQMRAEVEQAIAADDPDSLAIAIECRALDLLFSVYMQGVSADHDRQIEWLERHAPAEPLMWGWRENVRMVTRQELGLLAESRASLDITRKAFETAPDSNFGMIQLFVHEMLLDAAQGSLGSVSRMASDILRREPASLIGERCLHAMARMMSAWVGYQRSYRPQAANEMRLALAEYGRGEAWFDQYAIALPLIVDVRFRRDGLAEALRELEAAAHDHDRRGLVCLAGLRLGIELSCRARAGDIADIAPLEARCLDRLESPPGGSAAWRERDMLLRALCALALARRRPEQAARFADRLVVEGREGGRLCTQVQGLVLMARVAELAEDQVRADAVLLEAILLSSAEGMVAAFAEEGRALAPLLQRLASAETSSLAQRRAVAIIKAIKAEQQFAAADALSDREAEIVAHLADGASNKLIARRLGLTENTVKFHLKSIFAKLGVKTRKQAAMRVLLEG